MKAPEHLSEPMKTWWRQIHRAYRLDPHDEHRLQAACEAWDRCQQARRIIAEEGPVITDRFGQSKPHPAISIERDSRIAHLRALRELKLDDADEPGDEFRAPERGPGSRRRPR